MITAKRVEKLINNFEKILPFAKHEAALNMSTGKVSSKRLSHKCGTTHCHAGWYLLAKEWDLKSEYLNDGKQTGFAVGIGLMEKDLGLLQKKSLKRWASENPELWGNEVGSAMFFHTAAFGRDCRTLEDIVVHWIGVWLNLLEKEAHEDDGKS